jgi:glycosidase
MLQLRRLGSLRLLLASAAPALVALVPACSSAGDNAATGASELNAPDYTPVNLAAGSLVLYEAQVRTANACRIDVGTPEQRDACAHKLAPPPIYRAEGMTCAILADLEAVKLGTLDDLVEDTSDFRKGVTVRYVHEKVGANALWLMPLFPNNDRWNLPDGCDNLGSPYAVRDYFHASGTLSRACITAGRDEYSDAPCWANNELDATVAAAHANGTKLMLDIALNHFGHNYLPYDLEDVVLDGDRIAGGEDLTKLWDYGATYDDTLVHPTVLDSAAALDRLAARNPKDNALLAGLRAKCPDVKDDTLVRTFAAYRLALPNERAQMQCSAFLEQQVPGFYAGADHVDPSTHLGDNFTNDWHDVKFLFHHEENTAHQWEFARDREYLFRVLNYWASRGVDGFRFDHTTDYNGGMGSNEWKYLLGKVSFYAAKRGQAQPVYLAEEFTDQEEMNKVVDILTEGYVHDMTGRDGTTKDTHHIESTLENMGRFHDRAFVMTALETHDEKRLLDGTGFDPWTGAGFWGIGASTRSTPMMLMGQEMGSSWGLGFKRSDFLRARFVNSGDGMAGAEDLGAYYTRMNQARLDPANRALLATNHWYLRTRDGGIDDRIFAQVKWSNDANVVFVLHNLWSQDVTQAYAIPDELAGKISLDGNTRYRLFDVLSNAQLGDCRSGNDLRGGLYVSMSAATRAQWLRLEVCQ